MNNNDLSYLNRMKTAEEKAKEYADNEFAILPKSMAKEDMRHRAQKDFEAGYTEAMRCQSSPKIKQLEWVEVWEGYEDAKTPFGHYVVRPSIDNKTFLMIDLRKGIVPYLTLSEAKAAAKADFEKRVMECFDIADNSNK
jgi:hypothetical protein